MYTISISEIFSLPGCRGELQVGGSYSPWAKLACSALGVREVTSSPCYVSYGIGDMNPKVAEFFTALSEKVGPEAWCSVDDLNEDMNMPFNVAHEKATRLAVELALGSGLVEVRESLEKEFSVWSRLCKS